MNILSMKYRYSSFKKTHDRREALLSQIPYDEYVKQGDLKGKTRQSIRQDLKTLVDLGYLRRETHFNSARGLYLYRRIVG